MQEVVQYFAKFIELVYRAECRIYSPYPNGFSISRLMGTCWSQGLRVVDFTMLSPS